MFVVLSDVWLDRDATFARLRAVFEGFDSLDVIPSMFVLMGDFASVPFGPTHFDFAAYSRGFDRLAELVRDFPRLRQEARWVILPGPGDPGVSAALPRPALRKSMVGRARRSASSRGVRVEPGENSVQVSGPRLLPRRRTVAHAS